MGDVDMMWAQLAAEPPAAYRLFRCYVDMGEGRTLRGLAAAQGLSLDTVKRLSARWSWQARVLAWERAQWEAVNAAALAVDDDWTTRFEALRERQWALLTRVLERVEAALAVDDLWSTRDTLAAARLALELSEVLERTAREEAREVHVVVEYVDTRGDT